MNTKKQKNQIKKWTNDLSKQMERGREGERGRERESELREIRHQFKKTEKMISH